MLNARGNISAQAMGEAELMATLILQTVNGRHNDLTDLADVLGGSDHLRGRVHPVLSQPVLGEMGLAVEALSVALGPGGAATALATGVALWLRHRRPGRGGKVILTVKFPDGSSLTVDANEVSDVEAVIEAAVKPWVAKD